MNLNEKMALSVLLLDIEKKLRELDSELEATNCSMSQRLMVHNAQQALETLKQSLRAVEPVVPPDDDVEHG